MTSPHSDDTLPGCDASAPARPVWRSSPGAIVAFAMMSVMHRVAHWLEPWLARPRPALSATALPMRRDNLVRGDDRLHGDHMTRADHGLPAEHATDMVCMMDAALRRTYVSPSSMELLGFMPQEIMSLPIHALTHPDDMATLLRGYDEMQGGCPSTALLMRIRHRDGRFIWVEQRMKRLHNPATETADEISCVLRDVTVQVEAQAALRASEARMRLLLNGIVDHAVFLLDAEGRVSTWTEAAERMKGYAATEIIGSPFSIFYTPEDIAAGVPAQMLEAARLRGGKTVEGWRVRKDGTRFWSQARIDAIHGDSGIVTGFAKVSRDISRQHSEDALRRILVEAAPAGMMVVDADGTILLANTQLEQMFGYAAGELAGHAAECLVAPEAWEERATLRSAFAPTATIANLAVATATHSVGHGHGFTGLHRDGHLLLAEITVNAVSQGQTRVTVVGVTDITEQRRLNARDAHLQKMEAIGGLTAGIAHDFNNMLQAQMANLELLLDHLGQLPEAAKLARQALGASEHGAKLTHHLLSYARQQTLLPVPVDVRAFLTEFGDMLPRAMGMVCEVSIEIDARVGGLMVDDSQLTTALLNLLLNARDAMPRGGMLTIGAQAATVLAPDERQELKAGDYVVVSVVDSGQGIDEKTLPRVCEPFFTTKGFEGTGLGLSMVQGFARQSGGNMVISSYPGIGTRVELWLPATDLPPVPSIDEQVARGHGRVLLVDDATDVLVSVGAFLSGAGFEVVLADGGAAALCCLQSNGKFDILVTDMAMPGVNGSELARRARMLHPEMPIMVITGFAGGEALDLPAEGVTVLRKPFRRPVLVRAVWDQIERARPVHVGAQG